MDGKLDCWDAAQSTMLQTRSSAEFSVFGAAIDGTGTSSLKAWVYFTLTAVLLISTFGVFVRLFTRYYLMKSVVIEDYLISLAWKASQFGQIVPDMLANEAGAWKHVWDISLADLIHGESYILPASIVYGPVMILVKVPILLQYLRVFVPIRQMNPSLFVCCWLCLATVVLFYAITTILEIFVFRVQNGITELFFHTQDFRGTIALFKASGIFNVLSDVAILLLPLWNIYKLEIARKERLKMAGLFATGALACIASIMRTYYTWSIYTSTDISWNVCILALWTWAETAIGILAFCLPSMPQFFRYIRSKTRGKSYSSSLDEASGDETIAEMQDVSRSSINPQSRQQECGI